ncbi:uncharacterized protein LOC135832811 [Planococcus citri]|uniref:uncharacterized protein LOC135832811 n=1 Tax=Planococcus citri TaxID=170843 RepID=UPI0031F89BD5
MCSFRVFLAIIGILFQLCDINGERNANAAAIVYFSVPTRELAEKLSRALVEEKLVACVHIMPDVTAVFPTNKGEIKAETQTFVIAKSATSRIQEAVEFIKKNHPDSMPDVVATPIRAGNDLFLEWVLSVVPPNIKKCLHTNCTKTKPNRKSPPRLQITTLQDSEDPNVSEKDEQDENLDDEPPTEDEEENDGSENPNYENDPNE